MSSEIPGKLGAAEGSPQFVQPIARAAARRGQRRIPGAFLLALGTLSALGVAFITNPHDTGSVETTRTASTITLAPAAPIGPPPSPESEATTFDLDNGFSYSRLNTLTAFRRKYPDAICIDQDTCVSKAAIAEASRTLPCKDGIFVFERGRTVGLSCKLDVTFGAYLVLSTTEKYGPPDLVEDGQVFNIQSRHSSWFIKEGTFTLTTSRGYDFHGEPVSDDVTAAFHEGRKVSALPESYFSTAAPE